MKQCEQCEETKNLQEVPIIVDTDTGKVDQSVYACSKCIEEYYSEVEPDFS